MRTIWEVNEISQEYRQYFEEVQAQCGAPWRRVVEKTEQQADYKGSRFDAGKTGVNGNDRVQPGERFLKVATGWQPTCTCDAGDPVPCTVLDPFAGSGTTGRVAVRLGRQAILCDVSAEYLTEHVPTRTTVQMTLAAL